MIFFLWQGACFCLYVFHFGSFILHQSIIAVIIIVHHSWSFMQNSFNIHRAYFIQHASCMFEIMHLSCIIHHAFFIHHPPFIHHTLFNTVHSSFIKHFHASFVMHFSCIYSLLTWEWMVGRLLSSWGPAYFQVKALSFREGIHRSSFIIHRKARCFQPNNSTSPKPDSLTVSHHGSMGQLYIYESLIWVMTHLQLDSLLLNIMARRISGCHVCCRNFGCARFDN